MRRILPMLLAGALFLPGQKIETQKADRTRITRVETALNHLTVIEVGDPVEQVAAGSSSFKVEWRGNKVFLQPLEPDAATNLFIWTQSGNRLNYELVPAGEVEKMHFAIDNEAPVVASSHPPPVPSPEPDQPAVPAEMLFRSTPVKFAGTPGGKPGVEIQLRDLYQKDGKLYVRYAIRNEGRGTYQTGTPAVVRLNAPRSPQSLMSMSGTQLGESQSSRITAKTAAELKVLHSELTATVVRPGQQAIGFLALELPRQAGPAVLRFLFSADGRQPVKATLVL
jgi:hypothetical protein